MSTAEMSTAEMSTAEMSTAEMSTAEITTTDSISVRDIRGRESTESSFDAKPFTLPAMLRFLLTTLRALTRRPGLTIPAVLTLALGIGANTAMFSVVNSVLLSPLPFESPERLVSVWPEGSLARGSFGLFRDESESFETLMGYGFDRRASLTGQGEPMRLDVVAVTANFFSTLGVEPARGQFFAEDADAPGRGQVAVLSSDFHRQRFGGDPRVVGSTVTLDGLDYRVLGVAPDDFEFPDRDVDVWLPATLDPSDFSSYWTGAGSLRTIGRLAEGTSVENAAADLRRLRPALRDSYPWDMPEDYARSATVEPLRDVMLGESRPVLLLLLGAVGLVLLVTCVNVANLLLVHARGRSREMAVRAALGAGRKRIVGQLLGESLVLSLVGGGLGLLLALVTTDFLRSWLPAETPRLEAIGVDATVLAFTLAVSLATGLVFGLLPALRASRPDLRGALHEESRSTSAGRGQRRLAAGLVIAEVALTLVLVIGAGLLLRSFWTQLSVDPGFRAEGVLTARVAPNETRFATDEERRLFYRDLTRRLGALPGVESVAVVEPLPFGDGVYTGVFQVEGQPIAPGAEWPIADAVFTVGPGYLELLDVPLVAGRTFTDADRQDGAPVAIVSAGLARRYWGDVDVLGQRIQQPGGQEWRTIVGVVADTKLDQVTAEDKTALYLPVEQATTGPMTVALRVDGDPTSVAGAVRGTVRDLDRATPTSRIEPLDAIVSASLASPRFTLGVIFAFAALALVLAAVGIYGVVAHSVSQRRHELAVRLSFGASPEGLRRTLLRQGLVFVGIGLAIGLPVAFALSRLLESLLYGVSTTDLASYVGAAVLLAAVTLAATWIPTRRALATDPATLLRVE